MIPILVVMLAAYIVLRCLEAATHKEARGLVIVASVVLALQATQGGDHRRMLKDPVGLCA